MAMTEHDGITFLSHQSNGTVAAGAMCTMVVRPQIPLVEPYKLFIPRWIAANFTIEDVRVGNRSQFPQAQSMLAEQFSHGDGHEFKCEKIYVAMDFLMMVTNISGACQTFRASWACYLPKEKPLPFIPDEYRAPSIVDILRSKYKETKEAVRDKVEEKVEEFKQKVEQKLSPRKALPKPKDPPSFGWDPGYGDD